MSEQAQTVQQADVHNATVAGSATEQQVAQQEGEQQQRECPICTMMREGGCEQQFHAFMDCGAAADRGKGEYTECIKLFEAMRDCMVQNSAVFAPILQGMDDPSPQPAATLDPSNSNNDSEPSPAKQ